MRPAFYLHYIARSSRKDQFRKLAVTLICAAAVAFTALSAGFLGSFSDRQQEMLKNISERELYVYNPGPGVNGGGSPYGRNLVISEDEIAQIKQIDGVEIVAPVIYFTSPSYGYSDFELEQIQAKLENTSGFSKEIDFGDFAEEDDSYPGYSVLSYPVENYYDNRCSVLDSGMEGGAYMSKGFADTLGIDEEMVNGLTLTIDVWLPISIIEESSTIMTGEEGETIEARTEQVFADKLRLTLPIRGIIALKQEDMINKDANIYLLADDLEKLIYENADDERAQRYADEMNELYFPDDADKAQRYTVKSWQPGSYCVIVKDITVVEKVKEEIEKIDINFDVQWQFQDTEAGMEMISNNRNVMIYISLAILAVVFLLMALIYVYLIDRRKFEFAVLRANGLTKKEVRKIIYTEMFFQFLAIFLLSLICAAMIYIVMGKGFGYPFTFDGMTAVYALAISLGAVILPTAISLIFVNKFEPDAVMRN